MGAVMTTQKLGGRRLLDEQALRNKGCTAEGIAMILELRHMLTGRFGEQNTFITWARSLGKDGANARAFAQRMSEKLSSRPRKTGPAWDIVVDVVAAVVDPIEQAAEQRRLALMWAAANNQWPNGVSPAEMLVDEGAEVHDRAEQEVERRRELTQLTTKLAHAQREALAHSRMASELARALARIAGHDEDTRSRNRDLELSLASAHRDLLRLREEYAWLAALVTADPQRAAASVTWIAPQPATAPAVDRLVAAYLHACATLAGIEPQQVLESARTAGVELDRAGFADLVERGEIGDWQVVQAVTRLVGGAPERLCVPYATQRQQTVERMSRIRPGQYHGRHRKPVPRKRRRRMTLWSRAMSTAAALTLALAVLTGVAEPVMRGAGQRRPQPSSIDVAGAPPVRRSLPA
ncbi:hypothetical protein Asera_28200 [Actinocatenispora sera]|uniref:Uncharacterized protein n=2 Tax=Actinocatenispora sera TaxID=390989 RepID=A0A810L238_9ACTN|nr:hypothetical protein Asera_28200 [Actinocatenispora sera]